MGIWKIEKADDKVRLSYRQFRHSVPYLCGIAGGDTKLTTVLAFIAKAECGDAGDVIVVQPEGMVLQLLAQGRA